MIDLFSAYRCYFVAATLGAHSNFTSEGFRQRDVRFLVSLFLNWMDATIKSVDEEIHNTQIARYLESLVADGYALKIGKQRPPRYRLTRAGLLELVGQLTQPGPGAPLEQFYFVYYFARTYGRRLTELVSEKENRLPRSLQIELEALLDHEALLDRQIRTLQLELRKMDGRLQDTYGAAKAANELSRRDLPVEKIIRDVEERFPYDLNSQKPMSELLHEIPAELRLWELTTGNTNRAEYLWSSMKAHLSLSLEVLLKLKREQAAGSDSTE